MAEKNNQKPSFGMYQGDGSGISFETWHDRRSVGMHQHRYYEMLIVVKGSCRHIFRNTDTLLIPGDVVIVPPDEMHGLSIAGDVALYNCQFLPGAVDGELLQFLKSTSLLQKADSQDTETNYFVPFSVSKEKNPKMKKPGIDRVTLPLGQRYAAELAVLSEEAGDSSDVDRESYYFTSPLIDSGYEVNSNRQGVVHLNPEEQAYILRLFERIFAVEETDTDTLYFARKKYMEVLLLELEIAKNRQNQKYSIHSKKNQEAISEVLIYMEEHLAEELDFQALAEQYGFSTNYFRKIFRDVTGFSPVKYMNRLRIVRACDYIQEEGYSLQDAAAEVGILDFNYFSRLFKQIMGFSPSKL